MGLFECTHAWMFEEIRALCAVGSGLVIVIVIFVYFAGYGCLTTAA